MSVRLKDLLGLPEPKQGVVGDQAEEFRRSFTDSMEGVNRHLQALAGQANRGAVEPLESQKMKLYDAFQKTSALIDPSDPSRSAPAIERIMAAIKGIESKAAETATGATAGREKWLARENEFDNLVVRIGDLEEAGNPKAATLRKLADSIRTRANQCDYQQSVSALDQLQPKFDQIYQQHQQPPSNVGKAGSPPQAGAGTGFITGSVGKGGKNDPADVKAVQEALNNYGDVKVATDGQYTSQVQKAIEEFQRKIGQFKPDGVIQPKRGAARVLSGAAKMPAPVAEPKPIEPPVLGKASLDKGAFVWHSTRGILDTNIEELKKGVRAAYGTEHPELIKVIDQCLGRLGAVVEKLDTRLADALDAAYKAPNDQARIPELKTAQGIMKEYLQYVKSEPLIGQMDDNPFGVKTSLHKVITDALKHLAELLPQSAPAKA